MLGITTTNDNVFGAQALRLARGSSLNSNPRYTLVVSTCDAYRDALPPLFTLFRKYWPGLDAPIVLNTETAIYQHEGFDILCPQLYRGHPDPGSLPWSRRLKETLLSAVKTEIVLLFLDDFYLLSPVNQERFEDCLQFIEENKGVANIALFGCSHGFYATDKCEWIVRRDKRSPYIFNLQAGLWRKDRLVHFLRDHESPWHFERWGSRRARRYPDEFYATIPIQGKEAVFDYYPTKHGLMAGRWRPETPLLFEKEGISIDCSIRGIMSAGWVAPRRRRNWLKTTWNIWRSLRP